MRRCGTLSQALEESVLGKAGAVVRAYIKTAIKAKVLNDLTGVTESGLHQLWTQLQLKKFSVLACVVYRPPEIGLSYLENERTPQYI